MICARSGSSLRLHSSQGLISLFCLQWYNFWVSLLGMQCGCMRPLHSERWFDFLEHYEYSRFDYCIAGRNAFMQYPLRDIDRLVESLESIREQSQIADEFLKRQEGEFQSLRKTFSMSRLAASNSKNFDYVRVQHFYCTYYLHGCYHICRIF